MSTLSQFAPFAGGGLKSFQTGYLTGGASGSGTGADEDNRYRDVTVSAVNTAKTITAFQGNFTNNVTYAVYEFAALPQNAMLVTTRMTSSTNLRLAASNYSSSEPRGRWQVAEAN